MAQALSDTDPGGGPLEIHYTRVDSPLGQLWLACTSRGVLRISWRRPAEAMLLAELRRLAGAPDRGEPAVIRARSDHGRLGALALELQEYFAGRRRRFTQPVDLTGLTSFRQRVLRATAEIPFGRTSSYGRVAAAAGAPAAARAVGGALGANPVPIIIPCHRVIASDGSLGGFTGGTGLKRRLLALEGLER